jgi:molecular chaperone HscB
MDNYFELYGIPESFTPDVVKVKQKFYELSRTFHPDRVAQADEETQADALRNSALNNKAYKILTDGYSTMAYVLQLNGVLEEEEKYSLPAAFLMEMMDLNELVNDYEANPDNEVLKEQTYNTLQDHINEWESAVAPFLNKIAIQGKSPELLSSVKDFYFRKKYLLRIKERLITFASR